MSEQYPSFEVMHGGFIDSPDSKADVLVSSRADLAFELTKATDWINKVRVESPDGKLDIQATADSLGIALVIGQAEINGHVSTAYGTIQRRPLLITVTLKTLLMTILL